MIWGTIHRMILIDLVKVFVLSLFALTGMIMMAGVIAEAMKSGLGPAQIAGIVPLMLPSLLPYTIPPTTLFAVCIVYGRLAADNEILALKSAGVHIGHIVWPAILLGILTSALTMGLYIDIIPHTHFTMKNKVIADVEELLYTMLRKDGRITHQKLNVEIHVNRVTGRKLHNVIFKRRSADGKGFDTIVHAKEAELRADLAHKQILVQMRNATILSGQAGGISEAQIWPVELPPDFVAQPTKNRANDMTWSELIQYRQKFLDEKVKLSREIDMHQTLINLGQGQPSFQEHIKNLVNQRKERDTLLLMVESEFYIRPAFALGCLCFAMVACPVGIWFSKSDYLSAFITCFLPIVMFYYPVMLCAINICRSGKVPPWMGIPLADVVMVFAALLLFRKLARN